MAAYRRVVVLVTVFADCPAPAPEPTLVSHMELTDPCLLSVPRRKSHALFLVQVF